MEMCPFVEKHKYIVLAIFVALFFIIYLNRNERFAYSSPVSDILAPLRGFMTSLRPKSEASGWKDMLNDLVRYKNRTAELFASLANEPKEVQNLVTEMMQTQNTILGLFQPQISCSGEGCVWAQGSTPTIRTNLIADQRSIVVSELDTLREKAS